MANKRSRIRGSPSTGQSKEATIKKLAKPPSRADHQPSLVALEAARIGVWSYHLATNEVTWDSRCKALFGLPESQVNTTYQGFLSHLHPEDRKLTEDLITHLLEEEGDYDVIHRVIWPDESVHWLRCKGRLRKGPHTQLIGVAVDVGWLKFSQEEYRQLADQLRKANDQLSQHVRERTAEVEQRTAQVIQQAKLLDLANDAILVRGADHRISYWNKGAERLYGWHRDEAIGQLARDLLPTEFPTADVEMLNKDQWAGELTQTKRDGTRITVASRWTALRDENGYAVAYLEINTDISAQKKAEQEALRLGGRILALQDAERRKIAQELHDSLVQYLTCFKINLAELSIKPSDSSDSSAQRSKEECLSECMQVVEKCLAETRTLSYLMHPPLLDEVGLPSAIRWYLEGFVKRSHIDVHLNMPPEIPRLRSDMEVALFRILQESLTNVHRHSGGTAVEISIGLEAGRITFRVNDNGCGIPQSRLESIRTSGAEVGIGLAGMRERIRNLGGKLDVQSDGRGTSVTAFVPISPAAAEPGRGASPSRKAFATA